MTNNTYRVAHLADVHLGATPYNLKWRADDILSSLEKTVERIIEDRADLVVVAGDFFDKPKPDNKTIADAIKTVRPLVEHGIPIVFAYGEHDYPKMRDSVAVEILAEALQEKVYAPPRTVIQRTPHKRLKIANLDQYVIRIHDMLILVSPFFLGSPNTRKKVLLEDVYPRYQHLSEQHTGPVIHVAHLTLEHVFPHGDIRIPLDRMPIASYTALGHLHWRIIDSKAEKPYAYPGSLEPLKKGEVVRRQNECLSGFLMVDINSKGELESINLECLEGARSQLIVESKPPEIRTRIRTILQQRNLLGKRPEPLVYLTVKIPTGSRTPSNLGDIISSLERELGVKIVPKIEKSEGPAPLLSFGEQVGGVLDVKAILMRLLGVSGEKGALLADEVLELKNRLLEGDKTKIEEAIKSILRFADLVEAAYTRRR